MAERICARCADPVIGPPNQRYCTTLCRNRERNDRTREERKVWNRSAARNYRAANPDRIAVYEAQRTEQRRSSAPLKATRPPKPPPRRIEDIPQCQPGPIRQAILDGDWPALISALREKTSRNESGCWEWTGHKSKGYGQTKIGKGKSISAHRLMAMAMERGPVPTSLAVHHKCANSACVNPEHLQVVHPHENLAEMFERQSYLRRIAALEDALRSFDPDHPVLIEPSD